MKNITTLLVIVTCATLMAKAAEINVHVAEPQNVTAPADDAKTYYHAIPSTPAVGQALKVVETNDDTDYIVKAFKMKHKGIVNEVRSILERTIQKENGKSKSIVNNINGDEFLIVTAPDFQMPYIEAVIEQIDAEGTKFAGGGTDRFMYYCKNRSAEDLKAFIDATMVTGYGEVVADPLTGRIMINDSPSSANTVRKYLPLFDVAPAQLRLDIQIVEVEDSDDFNFGLALEAWKEGLPESVDMTFDWDKEHVGNNGSPDGWARTIAQNIQLSGMRPKAVANFINYLVRTGAAKVLSSPTATLCNSMVTTIESVDNVNYKGYNSDPSKSLDKVAQEGVIIKLKPTIAEEVTFLEAHVMIMSVVGWTTGGVPIINTRNTDTIVGVVDGQPLTLSGLKREFITKSDERVPVLGSIPLLGYFFRHEIDVKRTSEIIIVATPHSLNPAREAEDLKKVEEFNSEFTAERNFVDKFVDRVILNK